MKGRVSSWNDAKGFGFIAVDNQNEKIFFHISSVKKATRKPSVGDAVVFDASKDSQGRLKATHVLLEGIELAKPKNAEKNYYRTHTERSFRLCSVLRYFHSYRSFTRPVFQNWENRVKHCSRGVTSSCWILYSKQTKETEKSTFFMCKLSLSCKA